MGGGITPTSVASNRRTLLWRVPTSSTIDLYQFHIIDQFTTITMPKLYAKLKDRIQKALDCLNYQEPNIAAVTCATTAKKKKQDKENEQH